MYNLCDNIFLVSGGQLFNSWTNVSNDILNFLSTTIFTPKHALTCMILPRTRLLDTSGGVSITAQMLHVPYKCCAEPLCEVTCMSVLPVLDVCVELCVFWLCIYMLVTGYIYKVMSVLKILSGGLLQYLMWLLPKLYSIQTCTLMWDSNKTSHFFLIV